MYKVEKDWVTESGHRAICIAIENMHRCGYVGITVKNPLHGISYSQNTPVLKELWKRIQNEPLGKRGIIPIVCATNKSEKECQTPELVFNVHGGLTYCGGDDYPVKSDNLWWYGFDCGHHRDGYFEGSSLHNIMSAYPIRTVEYVVEECESLSKQLMELEQQPDGCTSMEQEMKRNG